MTISAARRSTDNALPLIVINKTGAPLASSVTISNFVTALPAWRDAATELALWSERFSLCQTVSAGRFCQVFRNY
jgi:hypothetical protein